MMVQIDSEEETLFIEWIHMKRKTDLLKRLRLNKLKRAERRNKEAGQQEEYQTNKNIEDMQCAK